MSHHKDKKADVISNAIIGAAIEVHRVLGPGLLESAYGACLSHELDSLGLAHRRHVYLPVEYKGIALESGYRLDLVVEDLVIVELKAVDKIEPIHKAQLLTYLRLTKLGLGLLINFNVPVLRTGISRILNP